MPWDITQVYGMNYVYTKIEEIVRPVPIQHPYLALILRLGIGLFLVLYIIASCSASTTYPKHYVDIATVYVAKINANELINPTDAKGA